MYFASLYAGTFCNNLSNIEQYNSTTIEVWHQVDAALVSSLPLFAVHELGWMKWDHETSRIHNGAIHFSGG
jgi:hypothetical protein